MFHVATLSLHAADQTDQVALCSAMSLPTGGSGAPEWVHLLPAGEIRTGDGRGPYRVPDAGALIAASRMAAGDRLPIDENHATDLAAPHGLPAPARGWIVELQARQDGIWGRVEWTEEGRRLLEDRAYRGISPAIVHERDGRVTAILRASLVNRPNLRGLTTLHSLSAHHASCPETPMNPLLEKLLAALGLPAATTEDAAIAAVTTLHAEQARASTALQAALDPIAAAAGLPSGADAAAVLLGVQQLAGNDGGQAVTALQAELASLTERFNALTESTSRGKAEAYVDAEIKRGRVGVKPLRERYIAMHMADAAGTEQLIAAMPILGGGGSIDPAPTPPASGEVSLQAEQRTAARLLGISEKDYLATLQAERQTAL